MKKLLVLCIYQNSSYIQKTIPKINRYVGNYVLHIFKIYKKYRETGSTRRDRYFQKSITLQYV